MLRRLISDITETYVSDIENVINKFLDDDKKIKLVFKKGSQKEGIVDVSIKPADDSTEAIPFFRVIALSNPMMRIKSLMYPNLGLLIFDEFICNTRLGEKYLPSETFKFSEIYNTFQREAENLRCIFMGNPYSLYSPYFSWIQIETKKLYPGSFTVGDTYVVECYELTDELKQYILNKNPLYKFDQTYKDYAFDGRAVNDRDIRISEKLPDNFALKYVFYIDNKKMCVYRNACVDDNTDWYWCTINNSYESSRRDIITFDYNSLINGTILLSKEDRKCFIVLKNAFRLRKILFRTIEESYLFERIYENI